MKKNRILCFLFVLLLCCTGCKNDASKPDKLIDKDTMVEIMCESYLCESYLFLVSQPFENREKDAKCLYKELFMRYGITKEQYISSLSYYMRTEESSIEMINASVEKLKEKREHAIGAEVPASQPQ